jgi:hypothetical protein
LWLSTWVAVQVAPQHCPSFKLEVLQLVSSASGDHAVVLTLGWQLLQGFAGSSAAGATNAPPM